MSIEHETWNDRLLTVHDLRMRLEEAQETLQAIRRGDVDALIIHAGEEERVCTLREADHSYRLLFDRLNEGALTLAVDGSILYANARFAEMVGRPDGQVIGVPLHHFIMPAERDRFTALLERGLSEKSKGRVTLQRADGATIPAMVSLNAMSLQGAGCLCTAVVTDLTDLIEAQQALEHANRELEARVAARTEELTRSNEALQTEMAEREQLAERLRQQAAELEAADRRKDQFLAMLAHELRNPLGPIRNAVYLLKQLGSDNLQFQRTWEILDRQVQHQARLLDDLLDISRISQGKVAVRSERLDLGRLVRDAVDDCRSVLEEAGLGLTLDLPAAPVWVAGDPTRLAQAVTNLLHNTAKFTERGGHVTVTCGVRGDDRLPTTSVAGRPAAIVSVRDTGIGIAPEMLPHVFEAFAQADRSPDRSRGGLGLGLALVKGLVEAQGGRVEAFSPGLGYGAEFILVLPTIPAPAAVPPASIAAAEPPGSKRILIVEDNCDAAETLCELLAAYGHTVEAAYSGTDAVAAAELFQPEIILCDLGLPGMDGYQVAKALRVCPNTAKTRLIAVSGYGQEEDQRRSREAGFDFHLTKPVDIIQLRSLLEMDGD